MNIECNKQGLAALKESDPFFNVAMDAFMSASVTEKNELIKRVLGFDYNLPHFKLLYIEPVRIPNGAFSIQKDVIERQKTLIRYRAEHSLDFTDESFPQADSGMEVEAILRVVELKEINTLAECFRRILVLLDYLNETNVGKFIVRVIDSKIGWEQSLEKKFFKLVDGASTTFRSQDEKKILGLDRVDGWTRWKTVSIDWEQKAKHKVILLSM